MRAAWIEINLGAIRRNLVNLRRGTAGGAPLMGIIKADAYGHGAIAVARALVKEGVDRFGVAVISEALELRQSGITEPILILGYSMPEDYALALRHDITLTLFDYDQAEVLNRTAGELGKRARIHVKIDTGMGRLGYQPDNFAVKEIGRMLQLPNLLVEGVFSHLAWADNPTSDYARVQFERFQGFLTMLNRAGIQIPVKHISNSAATISYPEMHLDMVRPGVALYGQFPDAAFADQLSVELFPAMEVKARLAHVKAVPAGTPLSYGCTFTTNRPSIIGTVPMGYADGLPRSLSNNCEFLVGGRRAPLVGRVCMDQIMLDLTGLDTPKVNDEVVFIGRQGDEFISVDQVAARAGTINYEIITRMGRRMPRIYLD